MNEEWNRKIGPLSADVDELIKRNFIILFPREWYFNKSQLYSFFVTVDFVAPSEMMLN